MKNKGGHNPDISQVKSRPSAPAAIRAWIPKEVRELRPGGVYVLCHKGILSWESASELQKYADEKWTPVTGAKFVVIDERLSFLEPLDLSENQSFREAVLSVVRSSQVPRDEMGG
jgi:hypothetical protein